MHEPVDQPTRSIESAPRRGASLWLAAVGLFALLVAAFGYLQFSKAGLSDSRQNPISNVSSSEAVAESDRAAILAEFSELEDFRFRAYEEATTRHLDKFLTPDSPLRGIIKREISQMNASDLRAEVRRRSRSLYVSKFEEDRAVVLQVLERNVKILNSAGKDVSKKDGLTTSSIRWVLHRTHAGWRIHNSRAMESEGV